MHHHVYSILHASGHRFGAAEYEKKVVDPPRLPQDLQEFPLGAAGAKFVVAVPHGVDVGNVQELHLTSIGLGVLEALPRKLVSQRCVKAPSVVDLAGGTRRCWCVTGGERGEPDLADHLLVCLATRAENSALDLAAPKQRHVF